MGTQETEVESGLAWKLECRDCEANICGRGVQNLHLAEDFMVTHSLIMNHTNFNMDVHGFSILIENITDRKPAAE